MISDEELKKFNEQGFIPGIQETDEQYLKRIDYCLKLKNSLDERVSMYLKEPASEQLSREVLSEAFELSHFCYDIKPDWMPLMFSNYKLAPWHGGSAWIFQIDHDSPVGALLQLREKFRTHKYLFGFYERRELVAHELSHIGRMMFEEPKFEEMLAYQCSDSWISRELGPILQSSKESILFVLLVGAMFFVNLFLFIHDQFSLLPMLLPILLAGYGLWRLFKKKRIFLNCLKNLENTVHDEKKARAIIYRLTDQEIELFSNCISQEYILNNTTLRWRLIRTCYLH